MFCFVLFLFTTGEVTGGKVHKDGLTTASVLFLFTTELARNPRSTQKHARRKFFFSFTTELTEGNGRKQKKNKKKTENKPPQNFK